MDDVQKIAFLKELLEHLKDDGQILIGDVAFETCEQLNRCLQLAGDEWDDEEIYFVADEIKKDFPNLSFTKMSYCSGVLSLHR